jgi:hypothetical protein
MVERVNNIIKNDTIKNTTIKVEKYNNIKDYEKNKKIFVML